MRSRSAKRVEGARSQRPLPRRALKGEDARDVPTVALQPGDTRSVGPLRLLRRHLPLKGEDGENNDVLLIQALAGGGLAQVLKGPEKGCFSPSASTESLQPDDSRFGGPLRLLRRHLPLKGEDCENDDVLIIQGLAGGGLWRFGLDLAWRGRRLGLGRPRPSRSERER